MIEFFAGLWMILIQLGQYAIIGILIIAAICGIYQAINKIKEN